MRYTRSILIILTSFLLLIIIRCDPNGSEEPTEEELQISKLAKHWEPAGGQFVMLGNEDVSSSFQSFILSFDNQKGFVTKNGNNPVWPTSGTYEFDKDSSTPNLNRLIRDDGVVIDIVELTEESLKITFYYDGSSSGGRVSGLSGEFSFSLMSN